MDWNLAILILGLETPDSEIPRLDMQALEMIVLGWLLLLARKTKDQPHPGMVLGWLPLVRKTKDQHRLGCWVLPIPLMPLEVTLLVQVTALALPLETNVKSLSILVTMALEQTHLMLILVWNRLLTKRKLGRSEKIGRMVRGHLVVRAALRKIHAPPVNDEGVETPHGGTTQPMAPTSMEVSIQQTTARRWRRNEDLEGMEGIGREVQVAMGEEKVQIVIKIEERAPRREKIGKKARRVDKRVVLGASVEQRGITPVIAKTLARDMVRSGRNVPDAGLPWPIAVRMGR
jgi:hypothetical protein